MYKTQFAKKLGLAVGFVLCLPFTLVYKIVKIATAAAKKHTAQKQKTL